VRQGKHQLKIDVIFYLQVFLITFIDFWHGLHVTVRLTDQLIFV